MMEEKVTIGNKIRELRKRNKLSQEELAKRLGVSRSTVAGWETDHREPEASMLVRIAKTFDVPVDVLVNTLTLKDLEDPLLNMAMMRIPRMTPAMRRSLEAILLLIEEYDKPDIKAEPKK